MMMWSTNSKGAIGVNGINLASVRPDFLDRALVIEVKRIPKDRRKRDEDIKKGVYAIAARDSGMGF